MALIGLRISGGVEIFYSGVYLFEVNFKLLGGLTQIIRISLKPTLLAKLKTVVVWIRTFTTLGRWSPEMGNREGALEENSGIRKIL